MRCYTMDDDTMMTGERRTVCNDEGDRNDDANVDHRTQ
jgi:hypothetical protein